MAEIVLPEIPYHMLVEPVRTVDNAARNEREVRDNTATAAWWDEENRPIEKEKTSIQKK